MPQGWVETSVIRAAPSDPMNTVVELDVIGSVVAGDTGSIACAHVARSVMRAAARPWISTVVAPAPPNRVTRADGDR